MAYELIIKNGTVIDRTGSFRRRADVAVKDGIVAEIGRIKDGAAKTIDASDLIVTTRLRRSTYSLRCSDLLGSISQLHFVARSHDRADGKLRGRNRALQTVGPRDSSVGPGKRRGNSIRRTRKGN